MNIITYIYHLHTRALSNRLLPTTDAVLQDTFFVRFSVNFLTFPPLWTPRFLGLTDLRIHKQHKTKASWVSATDSYGEKWLPALQLHFAPQQWRHVQTTYSNTALCTEFTGISCNSAFPYKAPPAVRECIYRDLYLHSACVQFLSGQKQTKFACPAVLWPVDEKQAYVDSTHLNNSEKWSWIIYGTDKIHIIIY